MLQFSLKVDGLEGAIAALEAIASAKFAAAAMRLVKADLDADAGARYQTIATTTPWAESSLGRKKRFSREIITPNSLYGVDSGALRASWLESQVNEQTGALERFSEIPYAPYQNALYAKKSRFAGEGLLGYSEEALDAAAERVLDEAEKAWTLTN